LEEGPAWLPTRAISSNRLPPPISSGRQCSRGKLEISSNFHSHIPLVSGAHRHIAASSAVQLQQQACLLASDAPFGGQMLEPHAANLDAPKHDARIARSSAALIVTLVTSR
jgi:hypothetical protein